jgi:hypothetical protein
MNIGLHFMAFDEQPINEERLEKEIAALKAERDRLKEWCRKLIEGGTFPGEADGLRAERDRLGSYNSHLIADREILFAENTKLRAALEAVLPIAEAFRGRVDMEPKLQIARRAVEGTQK